MITIDNLLLKFYKSGVENLDSNIPVRDKKILNSLSRQINSGNFLTENQAKLLVKIFSENETYLEKEFPGLNAILSLPTWSQPFRKIEQVRNIFLSKDYDTSIVLEFTHNKRLKEVFAVLQRSIQGQVISLSSRQYAIPLTEKNVYLLVNTFRAHNFNIEESILRFYDEISEFLKNKESKFDIFSTENNKLVSQVKKDIGEIREDNLLLLHDRKIRYQYTISPIFKENTLTSSIVNRTLPKIYINKSEHSLNSLIKSLVELQRLPLLVVFDGHSSKDDLVNLINLRKALEDNLITNGIGVYFRFDNGQTSNKIFNSMIGDLNYNCQLDKDTNVVGISNSKMPKFMLKSDWYPKSVISFTSSFRNNKTVTYCDSVDLIVYYTDRQPLIEKVDAIL